MKKHFITVISALFLVTGFLFSCSNEIDNKSTQVLQALLLSQSDSNYGSLTVSGDSSRALDNTEIKHAIVTVSGYDSSGNKFTKTSGIVDVSNGSASGVSVTQIPVCKNAVVSVQGYSDSTASTEVKGAYVTALVEIKSGSNSVNVTRETSKTACVYKALFDAGVNTNTLTETQLSSINNAIPSGVDSCLIYATSIASAFKSNSLAAADTYKLTTGSVTVTANQYNGYKFQITDPLSSASSTLSSTVGGTTSLSGVAPGTWKLIVWDEDGTSKLTTKSVTVTSGASTSVTVGSATITDRIIVHLADSSNSTYNSSGYTHIYAWSVDSDSTKYAGGWPGTALSDSDGDGWYDYTIMNGTSYVTKSKVIFSKNGSPQTADLSINGAGEYWWNGSAFVTENPDTPPEPVTPSVSISPSSGEISLSSSISVTFDDGNDTITSATVTINGNTYNMGTSATTWSKSLSDLGITSAGTSITVSASVTNSVGTGSASASLTSKESGGLVENPNELRIYQVMVSSFQDGDSSIGYKAAYGPSGATKGGDLQGIINAADYIESLGCNAIWMTPIFQSSGGDYDEMSSTGYFAYDYFNIDNRFGTNEKFAELVEVFHNKGIAVILDGVFGHNGGSVAASPNRTGIKYPGITPDTANPVNYATNENSLKYYSDVASYWITQYKIDGWRFDQCYQLGNGEYNNGTKCNTGGHNYWYEIRNVIETAAASNGSKGTDWGTLGYMVGEDWDGNAATIQASVVDSLNSDGYGLNSCFDFPAYYQVVQGFAQEYGDSSKSTNNITTALSYLYKTYSEKGYSCLDSDGTYDVYYPNFMLTNHDLYRIGDIINNKWSCGYESDEYVGRNKVLLAAQCAYSGPITIYYGDEIGARSADNSNGSGWYPDNVARSSGKISGFTTYEQQVHDWTQKCLAARASHEALWNGTNTQITGESDFYVAKKVGGGETIYIAFNYNKTSSKTFSASGTDLISGTTYSGTVTVPALSAVYILAQ